MRYVPRLYLLILCSLAQILCFGQTGGDALLQQAQRLFDGQEYVALRSKLTKALPSILANGDTATASSAHSLLGKACYLQGDYPCATNHYQKASDLAAKTGDCKLHCAALIDIANVPYAMGEKSEAVDYLKGKFGVVEACADSQEFRHYYYNLGVILYELGRTERALDMLNNALAYSGRWASLATQSQTFAVIGEIYWVHYKQPELALPYFEQAKELADSSGTLNAIAFANIKLGSLLATTNEFDAAEPYLLAAEQQFTELGSPTDQMYASRMLAMLYSKAGRASDTYEEFTKLFALYDSVHTQDMRHAVAELRTVHATEQKELENNRLKLQNANKDLELAAKEQRNQQLLLLLALFALVAIGIGAWVSWRRNLARQKAELEHNRLQFKAMAEGEEKERVRIAKDLHDGLGQMLSTTRLNVNALEDSVDPEDAPLLGNALSLIDEALTEVRHISHALMPGAVLTLGLSVALEQMAATINAAGAVTVTVAQSGMENRLPQTVEINIYRMVQELINNMLKHADATKITLELAVAGNDLSVRVADNGKGFDANRLGANEGIGWQNIQSRAALLNGTFALNSAPGQGTQVIIKAPTHEH